MNPEPFNENESSAHDDFDDEQFLQEFNRELWHLFNKADEYNQQMATSHAAELLRENAGADALAVHAAAQRCLPMVRCAEIGERGAAATETEKAHLQDCRYCERIVLRFAGQAQAVTLAASKDTDTPKTFTSVEPKQKKTWREWLQWLLPNSGEVSHGWFGLSPTTVGLTISLLIVSTGMMLIWVLFNSSSPNNIAGSPAINAAEGPTPTFQTQANSGSPAAGSFNSLPPTPPSGTEKVIVAPKIVKEQNSPNEKQSTVNQVLRAAREYGEIPMPADVQRFFAKLGTIRLGGKEPKLLSPNRQATVEDQPTFHWTSRKGTSFKIVVRDKWKDEVAQQEQLTGHSWVIPKKLPPGIYYWEISAFDKDGKVVELTKTDAIFKVVDKAEVERVRNANISHLDKALYFIDAGLLKDAEVELEAEIKNTQRPLKARNILRQVRGWQRQLRVS